MYARTLYIRTHKKPTDMRRRIAFTLLAALAPLWGHAQQIGTWTNYMAYSDIQDIAEAGNYMFVRASNDLYKYGKADQGITTYDKVNGLNDTYVTHIKWNPTAKRLVVVYEDSNIDLLDLQDNTLNVSDLYSRSMTEDKTVNHVCIHDRWAFLATGFGIVRLNVRDGNISETYMLDMSVNYTYVQDGYLYAVSRSKGTYRASLTANLMDKSLWTRVGGYKANTEQTMSPDLKALAETLQPGGPSSNDFYHLTFTNRKLYSAGGTYAIVTENHTPGTIQVMHEGNWQTYDADVASKTGHAYEDLVSLAVDPTSTSTDHVFASGKTGLYEFEDGTLKQHFTLDNSPLRSSAALAESNYKYVLTLGIAFDAGGTLWVLNSQSATGSLFEYAKDGQWTSHHSSDFMNSGGNYSLASMVRPFFDSRGLLWFCNEHNAPAALAYYNPDDGSHKVYNTFTNTDGTTQTVTYVSCAKEDQDGNLWVGTNVGPFYLTPSDISSGSETFTQYKVARNDGSGLADYLLSGVFVRDMAIDGGNRKWFATSGNGVYLISSDNNTQVEHFTKDNSPLLSDNVTSVAIDGETGTVYFATDKGLCSYKSDATDPSASMEKDKVYAYPNPTLPGYQGLITVNGLTANADVKIVSVNGSVIAEGRSTGGTFTWDGCDKGGRRVNSGIYMVVTATADGGKGTVCKIAIVR